MPDPVKCPHCGADECARACSDECGSPEHYYQCPQCLKLCVVGIEDRDLTVPEMNEITAAVADYAALVPYEALSQTHLELTERIQNVGEHAPRQTKQRWALEIVMLRLCLASQANDLHEAHKRATDTSSN